jgi:hypothetical protein
VTLENDLRILDCTFVSSSGGFKSVRFFLNQDELGNIHIADFQWGGDSMPKSQIARHSLLIQGVQIPGLRDTEEEQLADYGKLHGRLFTRVVNEFSSGHIDASFAAMRSMPGDGSSMRICRHYLTCQFAASKDARRELEKTILIKGAIDPMFRYEYALGKGDRTAALSALDEVDEICGHLRYYDCMRATLLLDEGKSEEAYAIALNVTRLEPLSGLAYLVAIRALATMNRCSEGVQVLQEWCRIARPIDLAKTMAAIPTLKDFCSSREYLFWKKSASAAQ